ncbi:Serine-threonine/tyrosine-protein kinase catalytic domain [Trinorchestia longiramus]|nr:Serine-threonine/tyrosine-protein kinase catalytic domain [Trinorchestia longiramus]
MIHTFEGDDPETRQQINRLVNDLALIRHENVVLFMGACVTPPNLAVVTGLRRGVSLYHHSLTRPPLPYSSRMAISKQVSQAMSYLHSRGIVHGHLNSRNVFLEAKIKLSILDHSMVEDDIQSGAARIPRHLLNYLPPEMMRTIDVSTSLVRITVAATQSSDVYMFGVLMFELFNEAPPFSSLCPHELIYIVGTGRRQSTTHLHCSMAIKEILTQCWSRDSRDRPDFPSLLKAVTQTLPLHRSHSTSEPERINRVGVGFNTQFNAS